jgi:hypothetical protein
MGLLAALAAQVGPEHWLRGMSLNLLQEHLYYILSYIFVKHLKSTVSSPEFGAIYDMLNAIWHVLNR